MLTKDLVKFTLQGTRIIPGFVDPDDLGLRTLAEGLLRVFRDSVGKTRAALEEESKMVADASPTQGILARGLEKLLFDRVEFTTADDDDLIAWRHQLFLQTSQLLSKESFPDVSAYHQALPAVAGHPVTAIQEKLFSDLPENQPVERFRSFSAERLLHRYNCAQVQWLLLHARELTLETSPQDVGVWRPLLRRLRFHQLLARIEKPRKDTFKIHIDGPLNLFHQTKKYGLSLATFFPAVLALKEWRLEAEIELKKRKPKKLLVDHTAGLRSYSSQQTAYVPKEVGFLETLFAKEDTPWTLTAADDFIALPGDAYGFPDFLCIHPSGTRVPLELFHPWHGGPLKHRLDQLEDSPETPLLLGVDRKLAKNPEIQSLLETSTIFQDRGFLFRDMPSPKAVLKCLTLLTAGTPETPSPNH